MGLEQDLQVRSGNRCELCTSTDSLSVLEVSPSDGSIDQSIYICSACKEQVEDKDKMDENHWHCLNESMWSEENAVKVVVYRMLSRLKNQELLDMLYLEDDIKAWAEMGLSAENKEPTRDANGTILQAGDSVSVIKDLVVKGAGFTAKQGTTVKNIHLVLGNCEQIEGRVNGTKIVLLSCYLKKL
ncbi:PhnA domain-containing protein [Sulfurimonas sp. MAG313]|nr:alkylphosphonate utilization protein [Sulfurimonas sp. MAG313]MDF1882035.1 PhnA domain-containing protein [Sulfurimonas sp. MAG313]